MNSKLKAERERRYEDSFKVKVSPKDYKEVVTILNKAYKFFKENYEENIYHERLTFAVSREFEVALKELAAKPKYLFDTRIVRFFNISSVVRIHVEENGFKSRNYFDSCL